MKVSVIIPARDAKGTLADTLASVAAQTRRPAEVIVVDDCSTDGTGEIARDHAVVSSVIVAAGLGPAAATNLGVRQASGDWIALLDADDLWPAERLEQGIELAGRSGAHVVIGLVETFLDSAPEAGHGVGFEVGYLIGRAERTGTCAIVLYDAALKDKVSRLVSGNTHPTCVTIAYDDADDASRRLGEALARLGHGH
jgi:glycosyltransferase involved in cell wall biosynthesis